jgi:hypothetical protein
MVQIVRLAGMALSLQKNGGFWECGPFEAAVAIATRLSSSCFDAVTGE